MLQCNHHCEIKTKDVSVINGYQYFVVVPIEPSIIKPAIAVLVMDFLLQMVTMQGKNVAKKEV